MSTRVTRLIWRALFRGLPLPIAPELYDLIVELKQSRNSIDEKIEDASESLRRTSSLISEIEQILGDRTVKLEALRQEFERYTHLSELEEAKAQAIVDQLEVSLDKGKSEERIASFVINIVAGLILFVFGVICSPLLSQWLGIANSGSTDTIKLQPAQERRR